MASSAVCRFPLAQAVTFVWYSLLLSTTTAQGDPVHVQSGQSIQKAIDKAGDGAHIFVHPGTYAEQLTIANNGIVLVGLDAILVPPTSPMENTCSGLAGNETQAGICIVGADIELADYVTEHRKILSVGQPVKDVLVTGFEVRNFSGENIAIVGGQNVLVVGNSLIDGGQYGALSAGSNNSRIDANVVTSTQQFNFIAICMDDVGQVSVTNNIISVYYLGLCVQTRGAIVRGNEVTNSCIGAFIDPGIKEANVSGNHISAGGTHCPAELGVTGIVVAGAIGSDVHDNLIEGLKSGGNPNITGTGIGIIDFAATGSDTATLAMGNMVVQNIFHDNDLDLYVQTNGTGNVIENNNCSTPEELCK